MTQLVAIVPYTTPPDEYLVGGLVALVVAAIACLIIARLLFRKPTRIPPVPVARDTREVVTITARAAAFALKAIADRRYPAGTALRVSRTEAPGQPFEIRYDLHSDEDSDWVSTSHGVTVVVEKRIAAQLQGLMIDVGDGRYAILTHKAAK